MVAAVPWIFLLILGHLCFLCDGDASFQKRHQRKTPNLSSTSSSRERRKPNIILILTDDQDVELGSLNFMPKTLHAIRDQGAQFRHAYVTTPMCCPSRSSLLTGMYVHNHHVYTNNDNCSSTQWQATHETRSFATYLSNAGYRTGYFGKYLNKYNGSYVPPGWREWGGLIMNSKYYNYSINMNGKKIKHGSDYQKDYYPDLIANDSIAFLRQSKKNSAHKPVMLTMSFPAPHGPEDSAPQFSHLFFNVTTHHTPSYDYAPNPDKQWILQVTKKMQPIHKQFTDLLMTKRLQTLQSVDAAVGAVVQELEALGELDNTYIIYTSDHGYHLGQFGLIKGKSFPFEFDVRIPFLVRGPGVEPGTVVDDIVLNIDLAPTFLDIAGVEAPSHMDGRSVLPLFLNSKRKRLKWQDTFLIESSGRRETPYLDAKMKTHRKNAATDTLTTSEPNDYSFSTYKTAHHEITTTAASPRRIYESGEEVFSDSTTENDDDDDDDGIEDGDEDDDDLDFDIDEEIVNERDNTSEEALNLSTVKHPTKTVFKGEDNDMFPLETKDLPAFNKLERLALECSQDEMKLPCQTNQKWYCVNDDGRWRKHKCKSVTHNGSQVIKTTNNNNRNFRKCACFTATGLIYRKIPLRNITRRHTTRSNRFKRDDDLSEILFRRLKFGENGHLSGRAKRDALERVEDVMKDVQGKLTGLKTAHTPMNLDTNTISEISPGCVIMDRGRVNCSTVIYQDRKTWRQSRNQIDNQIHELKEKLEKLKEIRRHLKHAKPHLIEHADNDGDEDFWRNSNKTNLELNELNIHLEGENDTRKRKRKRPLINSSTTTAPVNVNSHHRHNHNNRILSTTHRISEFVENFTTLPPKHQNLLPRPSTKISNDYCHCEPEAHDDEDQEREAKRRAKEEKLRRKLRKQRKKDQMEKECSSERMNCFHHDNEHWKTAPMWTEGPFCFCMNANNNTYSCIRTINSTHNFLYCEFTTGLVTFYNLRIDPYELQNRIDQVKSEERSFLHGQLKRLMGCRGKTCTVHPQHHAKVLPVHLTSSQHRYKKRNKLIGGEFQGGKLHAARSNKTTVILGILRETGIKRKRRKT